MQLLRFAGGLAPQPDASAKIVSELSKYPARPPKLESGGKYYFENLELQPIKVNITFTRSKEEGDVERMRSSFNALKVVLAVFSNSMGSIDGAPIKLNALDIEHLLGDINVLIHLISTHYIAQAVGQLHSEEPNVSLFFS